MENKQVTPNCDMAREYVSEYRYIMEAIIKNSVRIKREMGMYFYIDKHGRHIIGDICTGSSYNLITPLHIQKGAIGSFHTHAIPHTTSDMSCADILYMYTNRYMFECVGSESECIRCYSVFNSRETKHLQRLHTKLNRYLEHDMYQHICKVAKYIYDDDLFYPYLLYGLDVEEFVNILIYHPERGVVSDSAYRSFCDYITHIAARVKSYPVQRPARYDDLIKIRDDMEHMISVYDLKRVEMQSFKDANKSKIFHECTL